MTPGLSASFPGSAAGVAVAGASGISMPRMALATDFTRSLTAHSGSHAILGSLGRGGWARFYSLP